MDSVTTLVMSLMIWISQATGWAVPDAPKIEHKTQAQLVRIAYECDLKITEENNFVCKSTDEMIDKEDAILKPLALYDTIKEIIYLPAKWNPDNIKDQSILLHELVHYMQWKNKIYPKQYGCRAETEKEAYDLQEKFLAESGMDLHKTLPLGHLLRFMLTSCSSVMYYGATE